MIETLTRDRAALGWLGALLVLIVASLTVGFPAPFGVAVQGAVVGSVVAFIAIGLVLVYRTTRIINFVQAEIGAVATVVAVLLVVQSRWNWVAGVAVGIIVALALGGLIELTVVRRFFKAPRLILTVATIVLAQILLIIRLLLPGLWNVDFADPVLPTPFDATFRVPDPTGTIGPVIFDGNHVLAIVLIPLVILALGAFLRYTSAGIASRAVADNAPRASLLGIPVKRVSTIVWIVAAGLSVLGALLRASTLGLPILSDAFGAGLLVRTIAPAVVGRMENLRTTFLSALVLGVVDQTVFFRTLDPAPSNLIMFLVILAALLVQRRGAASRAEELEGATWQAVKEIRPIPRELRNEPVVRNAIRVAAGVGTIVLVSIGVTANEAQLSNLSLVFIFAIIGASLVILTGWAGQISLGQFAFVGVGAAICGKLAMENSYPLLPVLVLAGLVGAVVAVVIGLPALRIRGLFLAASTLAFALFVGSMVLNPDYFGWLVPRGRLDRPDFFGIDLTTQKSFFFFTLVITALVIASMRSLRRSRTGRVLIGGRDNERAAQAFAVNVVGARLGAFALSGFYAGMAGGLYALHQNTVNAVAFGVPQSLFVFTMVVFGGLGSIAGAFLGAGYLLITQQLVTGPATILPGLSVLVIVMILPGGLSQVFYSWRDGLLRWFAKRKGLVVSALIADVRVDESVLLPGAASGKPEPERLPVAEAAE